jgi:hypothetical protein
LSVFTLPRGFAVGGAFVDTIAASGGLCLGAALSSLGCPHFGLNQRQLVENPLHPEGSATELSLCGVIRAGASEEVSEEVTASAQMLLSRQRSVQSGPSFGQFQHQRVCLLRAVWMFVICPQRSIDIRFGQLPSFRCPVSFEVIMKARLNGAEAFSGLARSQHARVHNDLPTLVEIELLAVEGPGESVVRGACIAKILDPAGKGVLLCWIVLKLK